MSKKNRFAKWEKIREKGKKNYIIYYGVLGWGLSAGILSFILGEVFDHGLNITNYFTGDWLLSLVIGLVSFLLGGILFGYCMWGISESYYHDKYSNK
ncbi:hypothetical protein N781_03875 [Pontibacillus halophilus JSM 076056 = DSM 19796]|uniref:Uncharacterized protein n=1 Tax=Pontibacillus halophilus JSM 076056 = DSM 19796 TaxID=1385510 RepID=A0A0A5GK76_9BACI|nr:hypothetical protein [Pontibacillus halophilus]KGX91628.1 hypothetical protein N781_03875 [Pontibacillus halophilus JSM 076056 = DSM 19796]